MRRRAKRLQIRRRNSPAQAGAARIVPLDHGLIPSWILAGSATFLPLRLTPCRLATCRLRTVVIATIGFVPSARCEYRGYAGPAWTTRQRELARASGSRAREAVATVWFAR